MLACVHEAARAAPNAGGPAEPPTATPPTADDPQTFGVNAAAAAAAMRFGWALAEVRGRFDPWCPERQGVVPGEPTLLLDAAHERSATECQIEAAKVLAALDDGPDNQIGLDAISDRQEWLPPGLPDGVNSTAKLLLFVAARLIYARTGKDMSATLGTSRIAAEELEAPDFSGGAWWKRLQWFLWAWDEALQDKYATGEFGTASAYQLGRGLAEAYWALGPNDPDKAAVARRWRFYLGHNRVRALTHLCRRLAPIAIKKQAAPAIVCSLDKWEEVAAAPDRYVDPVDALEGQVRIWRDLLVTGADPLDLADPARLEDVARDPRPILKAFRWELLVAVVGALALSLGISFLSSSASSVVSALSAVGITSSGLVGWTKSRMQGVRSRVGDAVDQSVANEAVLHLPRRQDEGPTRRTPLSPWRSVPDGKRSAA